MRLFHGTTKEYAKMLLENGWTPNRVSSGGNSGQSRFLYITDSPDNALWFSEQKGDNIVLEVVDISIEDLRVDPEDGINETVEEELNQVIQGVKYPAYLVLFKSLGPAHFKLYSGSL